MNSEQAEMEQYLGEVRALVWQVAELAPQVDFERVNEFIEHGEIAEGLRLLAWKIHSNDINVPFLVIELILEYTTGMIDPEDLPLGFSERAVGSGEHGS